MSDSLEITSTVFCTNQFFLHLNISPFCGQRPKSYILDNLLVFEVVILLNKGQNANSTGTTKNLRWRLLISTV